MLDRKSLGTFGEDLAVEYLKKRGYKILDRNWRVKFGEIDIVAKKPFGAAQGEGDAFVFVEVKTLTSQRANDSTSQGGYEFRPEDHFTPQKQRKIKRLAELWLLQNKKENRPWQIDLLAITSGPEGPRMQHYPQAVIGS